MKSIFYSFLLGGLIGGGGIFLLLSKSTPVQATMTVSSSDPNTKITNEHLEVKSKLKIVEVNTSFTTDKKGTFTNTITINRRDLQYHHQIYAQSGYFMNSQLIFLDLGYSYKWLLISTKIGYSFRLQEIDYGLGIGIKYSF